MPVPFPAASQQQSAVRLPLTLLSLLMLLATGAILFSSQPHDTNAVQAIRRDKAAGPVTSRHRQQEQQQQQNNAHSTQTVASDAIIEMEIDATLNTVPHGVNERGLVNELVTAQQIVQHHTKYCHDTHHKHFQTGHTLGYITPWNSHGYDVAKTFASKFDYVSPVWYQIKVNKPKGGKKFVVQLTGGHDVDKKWMEDVRTAATQNGTPAPRIVPRFILETTPENHVKIAGSATLQRVIVQKVVAECESQGFDGIVLENTDSWAIIQTKKPAFRAKQNQFMIDFARGLHAMKPSRQLILVVRPWFQNSPYFAAADFELVHKHIDKFSLMTYDYSSRRAGPSAPLPWMEASVRELLKQHIHEQQVTSKILLGLNFYGMKFESNGAASPVLAHDVLKLLARPSPPHVQWDQHAHEHHFVLESSAKVGLSQPSIVYYPTLQSLTDRIQLAQKLKTGLSIWECGQGMDYFYDLF